MVDLRERERGKELNVKLPALPAVVDRITVGAWSRA
jgi:hypothetical protein